MLLSGCVTGNEWVRVDAPTFSQSIDENPDAFLLDVRTEGEWEQDGHLKDAILIPHTELKSRADELPEDLDTMIHLYCRSGNRSQQAAQTLQDLGYTNLVELSTGITGWKDAGYDVVYD